MENLIFLLTASLVWYKSAKKFKKTFVGERGHSVLFAPGVIFEKTSNEGDEIFFAEHEEKFITYGVLIAHLDEKLFNDEALEVLHIYLKRLRKPFKAAYNTGITQCTAKDGQVELVDYWQDENQVDWKVKACSDGSTMTILYVKNINDAPVEKQEAFLNSFDFGNN